MLERLINFGNSMPGVLSLGLIWGIMAIGLYITYKVLELSDLTVDGSFCTGGAVCIVMMATGYPTWLAMVCAFVAGMLTGSVTGVLHTKCKIPAILAGILTQLGLWTVNMLIMGWPKGELVSTLTIPARNSKPLVSALFLKKALDGSKPIYLYPPLVLAVITILVIAVLYWFFGTERGASIRATGANEHMARAQGINTNVNKMIGLMLANGLVALSGALFAQYNGNAEINMGRGAIVIGLAAIIIGEVLFGKLFKNFALKLLAVSFGAIIYYVVIQAVLTLLKVDSQYLKLMSAAIVAIFLTVPNLRSGKPKKVKQEKPKKVETEKPGKKAAQPEEDIPTQLPVKIRHGKNWKTDAAANALWDNIHKTFNAGTINEKKALQGLTLHLEPGDFVTVIGGNGAGKSTLMNSVSGVYGVDAGRIVIAGKDMTRLPEHKRARYIGRVFQDPMMGTAATMQIEENMALAARRGKVRTLRPGIGKRERRFYREQLKILDLGLEDRMTSKVGLLSGGQRQALTLLMATLQKPKLLLLDEHTAALDPKTAAKVLDATQKIVEKDHLTTLMITHNMRDAITYGNRLIMMYNGRIVVDVSGEQKKSLTVEQLLNLFSQASGSDEADDKLLLS